MKKIDLLLEQSRKAKQEHEAKVQGIIDKRKEAEQRRDTLNKKLEDFNTDTGFEEYVAMKTESDRLEAFIQLLAKKEAESKAYDPADEKARWAFMKECTGIADDLKAETVKKLERHVNAIVSIMADEKEQHDLLLESAYTDLKIHNVPDSKIDGMLASVRRTSSGYEYLQMKELEESALNFKKKFSL